MKTGRAASPARAVAVVLAAALCAGCATGVVAVREPDGKAPPRMTLAVQSTALNPRNGGQLVGPEALRPGDILLSADAGVTSAGIRLMTLSPVSHAALYVGDGYVAEAVGSGVRARSVDLVLKKRPSWWRSATRG